MTWRGELYNIPTYLHTSVTVAVVKMLILYFSGFKVALFSLGEEIQTCYIYNINEVIQKNPQIFFFP